ncbi:hypothetical protein [Nocardia spumae]|uniref:hypothetical protein n=1 Tax=Nocardia spumae TaxID=2887190 RepID=UPI001D14F899|nr:hypothetical protein [Nocardia spumae]
MPGHRFGIVLVQAQQIAAYGAVQVGGLHFVGQRGLVRAAGTALTTDASAFATAPPRAPVVEITGAGLGPAGGRGIPVLPSAIVSTETALATVTAGESAAPIVSSTPISLAVVTGIASVVLAAPVTAGPPIVTVAPISSGTPITFSTAVPTGAAIVVTAAVPAGAAIVIAPESTRPTIVVIATESAATSATVVAAATESTRTAVVVAPWAARTAVVVVAPVATGSSIIAAATAISTTAAIVVAAPELAGPAIGVSCATPLVVAPGGAPLAFAAAEAALGTVAFVPAESARTTLALGPITRGLAGAGRFRTAITTAEGSPTVVMLRHSATFL